MSQRIDYATLAKLIDASLHYAELATIIELAVALWEACPDQFPGRPPTRSAAILQQLVSWDMHWQAEERTPDWKVTRG